MKTKREMRQIGKRGISVLLLCTMLFVPQNVKAEEVADQTVKTTVNQDKITYPTSRYVWSCDEGIGDDEDLYLYGSHTPKGAKIINLKSSNPKIVKAKIQDKVDIHFTRKNAGTTTLSYDLTWKEKDGTQSTKHFTTKITLWKYQNPCASFSFNGKNYASKFKKHPFFWKHNLGTKVKISVKPKKGWKLVRLGYTGGKKIKNNSTIRLKKGIFTFITADFKNTKTKRVRSVRAEVVG